MKKIFFVLLALLLATCASLIECPPPPEEDEEEIPVGTLVIAQSDLVEETYLPWNGGARRAAYLVGLIYEPLLYKDWSGRLHPLLATNWTISPDGKQWTLTLRQGVPFHGGWGSVTSADVKFTFEQLMSDASVSHLKAGLRADIYSILTPNPYTVVFNLTGPRGFFLDTYCCFEMVGVVCKNYVETVGETTANDNPIGTGLYQKLAHVRGSYIELKVIDNWRDHWRVAGTNVPAIVRPTPCPEFEKIRFARMPEVSTRLIALMTGLVHMAELTSDVVPTAEAHPELTTLPRTPRGVIDLVRLGGLNMLDVPPPTPNYDPTNPWSDNTTAPGAGGFTKGQLVRKALNLAINKTAIALALYHGAASPAPAPIDIPEWATLPPYPYNPSLAMAYLSQAGYPSFNITLIDDGRFNNSLLAPIVKAAWEAIGLTVTIETWTWSALRESWLNWLLRTGYAWMHRSPAAADPILTLNMGFLPTAILADYSDPTTESLRPQIVAALDPSVRSALYTQFEEYINEQATQVFLCKVYEPLGVRLEVAEQRDAIDLLMHAELIKRVS